jgi:hypothetical protein
VRAVFELVRMPRFDICMTNEAVRAFANLLLHVVNQL